MKQPGDRVFESTFTKIGWNKWIKYYTYNMDEGGVYSDRSVQGMLDGGMLEVIWDQRRVDKANRGR